MRRIAITPTIILCGMSTHAADLCLPDYLPKDPCEKELTSYEKARNRFLKCALDNKNQDLCAPFRKKMEEKREAHFWCVVHQKTTIG